MTPLELRSGLRILRELSDWLDETEAWGKLYEETLADLGSLAEALQADLERVAGVA